MKKEAKDGETEKLKKQIRRLEKDKRQLISKLKTLEQYFEKTNKYVSEKLEPFSVEQVIKLVDEKNTEEETTKDEEHSLSPKEAYRKELVKRFSRKSSSDE